MQAGQSEGAAAAAAMRPPPPPPREQAVLVLGATGRVGRRVVQKVGGAMGSGWDAEWCRRCGGGPGGRVGRRERVWGKILCGEQRGGALVGSSMSWMSSMLWMPAVPQAESSAQAHGRSCTVDGGGCLVSLPVARGCHLPLHPAPMSGLCPPPPPPLSLHVAGDVRPHSGGGCQVHQQGQGGLRSHGLAGGGAAGEFGVILACSVGFSVRSERGRDLQRPMRVRQ